MSKLFLILMFLSATLSAQDCAYEDYHSLVTIAKKQCAKKDYKTSRNTFKDAFSKVNFPLGHDLSFALIVARETKDRSWAMEIAIQLAKGGIPIRYFNSYNKSKWYKEFKANFKEYSVFYQENFNQDLKEKWIGLILKDRDFNKNRYHAFREAKIKLTLEELISEASAISKELESLVKAYGFPGEQEMGYLYIKGQNRVTDYSTRVLLRHIYQRGELLLVEKIPEYICNGKLRSNKALTKESIGLLYGSGLKNTMQWAYDRYHKD